MLTATQEQLVLDNTKLSRYIAKRYHAEGFTSEDLVSVGYIGLIKASQRFDASLGFKFTTLAGLCIKGEICRLFRKQQISTCSLNETVPTSEGLTERLYFLADETKFEEQVEIKSDLTQAISQLNEQERFVIMHRFGLHNGGSSLSQKETGELMGYHQVYISRIERRALEKLKRLLSN